MLFPILGASPRRVPSADDLSRLLEREGLDVADEVREGLDTLLHSIAVDARLHVAGRVVAAFLVRQALANRVAAEAAMAASATQAPRRPVIVACPPRTGSTLLHRMLAAAPDAMALPLWLMMDPMPPPPGDWRGFEGPRRTRARRRMSLQDLLAPGLKTIHEIRADVPEEDTFLCMPTFTSLEYWAILPVHGYAEWLLAQDPTPTYRYFRSQLGLLQWDVPATHWALKSPMHFFALETLLDVLPECRVVLLHRDVREVVPSMHSLFEACHTAVSREPDVPRAVAFNTRTLAEAANRVAALRDGPHRDRMLDVAYRRLVADPIGVARQVREWAGLPWDAEVEASMLAFLRNNPKDKHGRHRYSLEAYGLHDQTVTKQFGDYVDRFGEYLDGAFA